ncbi:deoxyribonuclease IV [Paenibacillus tuaregi]|uniref:deoxyribonuclease IV n=1 Tax=Paenibacillus tuaregi TaxID=1816681 RepID=UPI000838C199|nr:deoxyribonuclease IV [Paenibacillus tuaregi]
MTSKVKVGGHLSIRGGYAGAAKTASIMGAGAFQYFPKNPRSLGVKAFDPRDAEKCRVWCKENDILSVAHTPYPSNLAVDSQKDPEGYRRIVESLRNDLNIAEACGSIGIVVHFGTSKAGNPLQGYKNVIQCINEVLRDWSGAAKLLIENQAGDHGDMGMTMEEMTQIRKLCESPEHIGFCLDTCHAFAAGVWQGAEDNSFVEKGHKLGFWEEVRVIHLNDSKYPLGSRKDRHARVGHGYIGEAGFRKLLTALDIRDKAFILESETGEDGTYKRDMEQVSLWAEA